MSAVAKHLAFGLDLYLETQVPALRRADDRWRAETTGGHSFHAEAVVLTSPVPQALAMLEAGGTGLPPELGRRLAAIEYERCLAVLAVLEGPSRFPPPGGLRLDHGPIAWIADNQLKGISAKPCVTIHATHAFSLEHWDRDRQESGRALLEAAAEWLGTGIKTFQVHGWRYSKPMRVEADPCVLISPHRRSCLPGMPSPGRG